MAQSTKKSSENLLKDLVLIQSNKPSFYEDIARLKSEKTEYFDEFKAKYPELYDGTLRTWNKKKKYYKNTLSQIRRVYNDLQKTNPVFQQSVNKIKYYYNEYQPTTRPKEPIKEIEEKPSTKPSDDFIDDWDDDWDDDFEEEEFEEGYEDRSVINLLQSRANKTVEDDRWIDFVFFTDESNFIEVEDFISRVLEFSFHKIQIIFELETTKANIFVSSHANCSVKEFKDLLNKYSVNELIYDDDFNYGYEPTKHEQNIDDYYTVKGYENLIVRVWK